MGHMLGMPCLKLNNVGRKSASCGGFAEVAAEALEERRGRDPDIDRTKTEENLYTGFRSAEELMEYSRQHVAELSAKQKADGGRAIRSDAVVMCATIIKPPAALMDTLTREEQIRLLQDADEKLNELIGGEQNSKATVIHFDELGGHLHKFWEPMTEDGRLCAKEAMNLQFFGRLNREMPAFLRSRGWDIADCNAYDAAKEQLEAEQAKSEKRRKSGLTSVQFKAQAERQKNELCEQIDGLKSEAFKLTVANGIAKTKVIEAEAKAKEIEEKTAQKAAEAAQKAQENAKALREAEERLKAVKAPVARLAAIEGIERRTEKGFMSKKRVRDPEDDDRLLAAAKHGAAVDEIIREKEQKLDDLQRRFDYHTQNNQWQLQRMDDLQRENRELRTFKERAEAFLRENKLLAKFREFAEHFRERHHEPKEKTNFYNHEVR